MIGITGKSKSTEEGRTEMEGKELKIVIRTIAQNPQPEIGAFSVEQVESYIGMFLNDGWKLFATNYIGQAPEGYIYSWQLVR
jgi:hypothetical protein